MIQQLSGKIPAGLYTVSYSYASLTLIIFNALNSTYNPVSMKAIKEQRYDSLKKSTEIIVLLSVVFSLFMMLLAPEGLYLLGGREYLASLDIIPILILGIYFSSFYFIFSNVEFVYGKNKLIFPITLAGAVINLLLNWILIPKCGYKAAAYTTFIGYLFIAIMHCLVSKKIVGKDIYNTRKLLLYIVILITCGMLTMALYKTFALIRYSFIIIVLIAMIVMVYKNRNIFLKK